MLKNPNTKYFWDNLISSTQSRLINSPIYKAKCNYVLRWLKNNNGKTLDIGVGYGHLEYLAKKNNLDLDLYGIDITPKSINRIRKRFGKKFKLGSIHKIPFKNYLFKNVLLLDVYEHIPKSKSKTAMQEIKRVLKNDGNLILSIPLNDTEQDATLNGHLRQFDIENITSELNDYGFLIIDYKVYFAYKKFFYVKNFLCKLLPFLNNKPNLLIIIAQKI